MTAALLNAAAPLVLASLAAFLSDLSGALGVFIEGAVMLGAFFSWAFAYGTGSAPGGILLACALCAALGWGLARFTRAAGANPFIAGLAFNALAAGLTEALAAACFGTRGVLRAPPVTASPLLFGLSPFAYLAAACAGLAAFFVSRTRAGLALRASGLSFDAARERGLTPWAWREGAWAAAALLAALAGAALTFRVGAYTPGSSAGRGWIALAAVYLGAPWGRGSAAARLWACVLAALLFSAAERAGLALQRSGPLPPTALAALAPLAALGLYVTSLALGKGDRE
jgi:simple sugar transport system permease protein